MTIEFDRDARDEAAFLDRLQTIYAAARESDDGNRCMVAPSPNLHDRIKSAVQSFKASNRLMASFKVAAAETRVLGFNDGVIVPPNQFPLGTAPSTIRAAAARPTGPLRGPVRIAVVLVDFPDKPMVQSAQHFEDLFFSQGVLPNKSVREYYADVTNGLIDLQGEVVGPFRLPQTMATYAHGQSGTGGLTPNAQTMARDAALAADPSVDFTPYDNHSNGYVDAFIVIHAGAGGEVTGSNDDIWSHKWTVDGGALAVDGTHIFAYLTVPEDCKIGVCAHELGHLLFGFPDLYDTDYSSEGIGNWCLMAGGSWGGNGDVPVHPCAWCKANQGWVTVNTPTSDSTLSIADVKTSHTVYRLWQGGTLGSEYFLMENRQKSGFDASLPGDGLLIWHVDETQQTNTDENHYKVALMQADGQRDMELNANRGDAGDAYPGSSGNKTFNASSTPNSQSYGHVDTCVSVSAISASAPTMTAKVKVTCGNVAPAPRPAPAKKSPAKKATVKKAPAKKTTVKKATPKKAAPKRVATKKAVRATGARKS